MIVQCLNSNFNGISYRYRQKNNIFSMFLIMKDLQDIRDRLRQFTEERDWEQFHDEKNLALALSIEASELNECFLWKTPEQANRDKVKEELADVFLYAVMLADKYDFDIHQICLDKIQRNAEKYPVEKAKGSAKKYSEL